MLHRCSLLHRYTADFFFFFFNDTATTEIYTLSLHDALPIYGCSRISAKARSRVASGWFFAVPASSCNEDRKSTRLNSSHANISYAVFCLKKKKTKSIAKQRMKHQSVQEHLASYTCECMHVRV